MADTENPPAEPSDEALIEAYGDEAKYEGARLALRARLAAKDEALACCRENFRHELDRANKAEAALAECRLALTTIRAQTGTASIRDVIDRALATKEAKT